MKMNKIVWLVGAVVIVGAITASVLWQRGAGSPTEVNIAFNSWVGYGPLFLARDKGFFTKRGLNVNLEVVEEVADRRAGMIAGRLDGVGSTLDDLVVSAAQGVPGKMVLGLDESAGADGILTGQDVNSVEDFKGKTIAVQPGFVNHFFLLYILEDNGLSADEINVRPMDPDQAAAAFIDGSVDIAVTWEPHLSEVQKDKPDGKTFLTSTDYPGLIVDILVLRDDFIADNPGAVADLVAAWYEALAFIESNPDEAYAIMGQAMDIDPGELAEILSGVNFLAEQDNLKYYNQNEAVNVFSVLSTASQLWQAEGYIAEPVDPNAVIDGTFLEGSAGSRGWFNF